MALSTLRRLSGVVSFKSATTALQLPKALTLNTPLTLHPSPLIANAMGFASKADKRRVDPERPKLPQGSFFRFAADYRKRMEGSEMKAKELMANCGKEWKGLTAEERRPFEDSYQADKLEYAKKLQEYKESGKEDAWKRDPEKPKAPLIAYLRFCNEFRAQQPPETKVTEMSKAAGAAWKEMAAEQKQPYQEAYEAEKKAHDAAMAEYKASGKQEAWEKKVGVHAEKEKEAAEKAKKAAEKEKEKEKKAAAKAKEQERKEKEKAKKAAEKAKAAEKKQKEKEKKEKAKAAEKAKKAAAKKA